MNKNIKSIKHNDKRAHIPSREEAGYEDVNPKVKDGNSTLELPLNPVVHRGQDPELFWLNKYGNDDCENLLRTDIRSLYRHEHIAPESLISGLYKIVEQKKHPEQLDFLDTNELFGNALEYDELEKVSEYYSHQDGWTNRLIQGDSLLVMTSLLEREGMAGQVQTMYIDPPYGIKYNSNWQMKLNDRNVKDGKDEHLTGEPEMIKAFRDTWELGIHSYLSYLRDRLLVAKELLTESGSCFVQISDENVHLVRCLMDEVFGSENFINLIAFQKTGYLGSNFLDSTYDFIVWYAHDKNNVKFRQLFQKRDTKAMIRYNYVELPSGESIKLTSSQISNNDIPKGRRWRDKSIESDGQTKGESSLPFNFEGKVFNPKFGKHWSTSVSGLEKLANLNRIVLFKKKLNFKSYEDDFPVIPIGVIWDGMMIGTGLEYVVQTSPKVIENCILMSSDPGDLVFDPTCGSGTTAYVAEHWGRRWITIDTSRIALNIAKTRLMTANYPFYHLYSDNEIDVKIKDNEIKKKVTPKPHNQQTGDIRQGFVYAEVPHITLKALAYDEPPSTETLYDNPLEDKSKLRVSGPFTVETLQNFEPVSPESIDDGRVQEEDTGIFEERIFEHLKSAGIKNGIRNEQAIFIRIEQLADTFLHAEGFYKSKDNERKAYFHIGPKFGTVSKIAVNEAVKACRQRGDADWLVILGFSFESAISNENITTSLGSFEVTKVRMHDDLMQDGLLKKDKKAASFVTIGEPDIKLHNTGDEAFVEICGLDIYDPIRDTIKARDVEDIAYWMVDSDYDGSNFVVRQVFFCGGSKDEFKKWQKGLSDLSKRKIKAEAEKTLKIEIDDEAFDSLYGFKSRKFEYKSNQKVAVRVISQFGEESTKVM